MGAERRGIGENSQYVAPACASSSRADRINGLCRRQSGRSLLDLRK